MKKIKAKVKETDEIISVVQVRTYNNKLEWMGPGYKFYHDDEIELLGEWRCKICGKHLSESNVSDQDIDICQSCVSKTEAELANREKAIWEIRRYEIAKSVMQNAKGSAEVEAEYAVKCADALIAELKKNNIIQQQ